MAPGLLRAFAQGFRTVSRGLEPAVGSVAQKVVIVGDSFCCLANKEMWVGGWVRCRVYWGNGGGW